MKRETTTGAVVRHGVQAFRPGKRSELVPEEPMPARDVDHARRLAQRLAPTKAGIVVFRQTIDPVLGEYDSADILERHGQLPDNIDELLGA